MQLKRTLSEQELVLGFNELNKSDVSLPNRENWVRSLRTELNYWTRQFEGPAAELDKLQETASRSVGNLLPDTARGKRVLDLGCGPFPLQRDGVEIVAADPLAEEYRALLMKSGRPVPPRFISAAGETLLECVQPGEFDFVIVSACLDQCYDPAAFLKGVRLACKPGGTIVIHNQHLWDPVNTMRGARHWNLILSEDELILWRRGWAYPVRSLFGKTSHYEVSNRNDGSVTLRLTPGSEKSIRKPDYPAIYDAIYKAAAPYTASHTSPGLRTALGRSDKILAAGPRHLDIGAGPGYLVEVMSMPPFRKQSCGVDVSAVAVEMANKRLKPGVVKVMKPGEIPHPDGTFDLLTCFDVMEHLEPEDVRQLMKEMRRVARRGALGLFNISLRDSVYRDIHGDSVHRSILPPAEWDALIRFDRYQVTRREHELLGEVIF